jgi:hypothetical protein
MFQRNFDHQLENIYGYRIQTTVTQILFIFLSSGNRSAFVLVTKCAYCKMGSVDRRSEYDIRSVNMLIDE